MGMYDTINLSDHPSGGGQIKLFHNELVTYTIGDRLPLDGTYGIVLREGGVVLVDDGVITGWLPNVADVSDDRPLWDKYGSTWTPDTKGELAGVLSDPYFFK